MPLNPNNQPTNLVVAQGRRDVTPNENLDKHIDRLTCLFKRLWLFCNTILKSCIRFRFLCFNGISTFVGYIMPKPSLKKDSYDTI